MPAKDSNVASPKSKNKSNVDLQKYIDLVDRCAKHRLNFPIPNGSPAHARVLISKLFETARQNACLVSGKLTDATKHGQDIYGDAEVIRQAQAFMRRSESVLRIVLEKAPLHNGEENRFFKAVIGDKERKGTVLFYLGHDALNSVGIPHFMVTDALAYRFETYDSHTDENSIKAIANFGDSKTAKSLQSLFNDITTYLADQKKEHRYPPNSAITA